VQEESRSLQVLEVLFEALEGETFLNGSWSKYGFEALVFKLVDVAATTVVLSSSQDIPKGLPNFDGHNFSAGGMRRLRVQGDWAGSLQKTGLETSVDACCGNTNRAVGHGLSNSDPEVRDDQRGSE